MLCTQCGEKIRPVVCFDIDGTLGDYHTHFRDFCNNYFGFRVPGVGSSDKPYNGSCDFEDWLGLTRIEYREAKLAYRQGGTKRWMPIYPYAAEAVGVIKDAGAEVWIATTRPWQRLDNIDPDTREWLRRHELHYDGLLYGDDKFNQLCQAVDPDRIVAVIEDLPGMFDMGVKLNLPMIQVWRPHNDSPGARRNPSGMLPDCTQWALQRVLNWRR
jgi:FMN phosphatase YigB (HAD superfamily)